MLNLEGLVNIWEGWDLVSPRVLTSFPGSRPPLCACQSLSRGSPHSAVALETEVSQELLRTALERQACKCACVAETAAGGQSLRSLSPSSDQWWDCLPAARGWSRQLLYTLEAEVPESTWGGVLRTFFSAEASYYFFFKLW